ncbi:hypothetical protein BH23CHL5_BH23CHL5_24730 [soil metagenome]
MSIRGPCAHISATGVKSGQLPSWSIPDQQEGGRERAVAGGQNCRTETSIEQKPEDAGPIGNVLEAIEHEERERTLLDRREPLSQVLITAVARSERDVNGWRPRVTCREQIRAARTSRTRLCRTHSRAPT